MFVWLVSAAPPEMWYKFSVSFCGLTPEVPFWGQTTRKTSDLPPNQSQASKGLGSFCVSVAYGSDEGRSLKNSYLVLLYSQNKGIYPYIIRGQSHTKYYPKGIVRSPGLRTLHRIASGSDNVDRCLIVQRAQVAAPFCSARICLQPADDVDEEHSMNGVPLVFTSAMYESGCCIDGKQHTRGQPRLAHTHRWFGILCADASDDLQDLVTCF